MRGLKEGRSARLRGLQKNQVNEIEMSTQENYLFEHGFDKEGRVIASVKKKIEDSDLDINSGSRKKHRVQNEEGTMKQLSNREEEITRGDGDQEEANNNGMSDCPSSSNCNKMCSTETS